MNIVELENSLQTILKPVLGVDKFVPAKRPKGAPEPELPYCTYEFLTSGHLGRSQKGSLDSNGNQQVYEHSEVIFRITAIGVNAYQILTDLSLALNKTTITDQLNQANLPYSTKSTIRRLPQIISSSWEDRASINITFFTVSETTDNVGLIETVQIIENLKSDSGTTYVETFEVTLGTQPLGGQTPL